MDPIGRLLYSFDIEIEFLARASVLLNPASAKILYFGFNWLLSVSIILAYGSLFWINAAKPLPNVDERPSLPV